MAEHFSADNIMVVVDGTESGIHAVRYAVRLAAHHGAALTAVAVVDTATMRSLLKSNVLVEAEMEEFETELEASAQTSLNYVSQLAREAGVSATVAVEKGAAHTVITDQARRLKPDFLVMGTFSTSMIKRDLNARERRLIVDEAACPILLVP